MSFFSSKKIAVLRGGDCHFDTSIKTGNFILQNIPKEFEVFDVFIDKNGVWHLKGVPKKPESILSKIDFVWNALHGGSGENGIIQRLLEHFGIKHTSSSSFSSAICHNKHLTKNLFKSFGIKTPHHLVLDKENLSNKSLYDIFSTFPHPAIVKPVNSGHSVGVSLVRDLRELSSAVEQSFSHSPKVLIEEYIKGREFFVGVIENFRGQKDYTLPIVEIKNDRDFFDNESKLSGLANISYANVNDSLKKELVSASQKVVSGAMVRNYAGLDFIVSPTRGVYLLEINTQPQLLENSPFKVAMSEAGITADEFVGSVLKNL